MNFQIIERSNNEYNQELEENYQKFRKEWTKPPYNQTKGDIYQKIGISKKSTSYIKKYINKRLKEDNLPVNRFIRIQHTQSIHCTPDMKYIYHTREGTYRVRRFWNNKSNHYGTYKPLKEAKMVRDILKEWDYEPERIRQVTMNITGGLYI